MKLVIVSGLSGAGKTVALKQFEDLGYFCIDNLPLTMLGQMSLRALKSNRYERLAIGVDARENPREIARFQRYVGKLRPRGVSTHVVFLTAGDEVILRRYGDTRRKHPLTGPDVSLTEAIARERINVTAVNTLSRGVHAFMRFTLQVGTADAIQRVLRQVKDVPGVDTARRL